MTEAYSDKTYTLYNEGGDTVHEWRGRDRYTQTRNLKKGKYFLKTSCGFGGFFGAYKFKLTYKPRIIVDGKIIKYLREDGTFPTNQLVSVDGKKYYFDGKGNALIGKLQRVGKDYYYFGKDGAALTYQLKKVGKYYYFFGKSGKAVKNKLKNLNGKIYYFGANCRAVKNTLKRVGKYYYYLGSNCRAVKNTTKTVKGVRYRFDRKGRGKKV